MKTNGNETVYPVVEHTDGSTMRMQCIESGLTKREYMAIEFTKALISHYGTVRHGCNHFKEAVNYADELIKQLNENNPY